ncbi:MAG: thioredoxin [Deltaproteobacteria bacterium]|nr:thioredoxin [Deltaproteobacteria bacterium]
MVRCPACGAQNRVPQDKLDRGLAPKCGRCKTALPVPVEPRIVTDASFAEDVERSPLPVLLDAWAPWCGPCRLVAPAIEALATEWAGRVRVAKLNVDENPVTAGRFQLRSIPTLLALRNGHEIDRLIGAHPKIEIVRWLERTLG